MNWCYNNRLRSLGKPTATTARRTTGASLVGLAVIWLLCGVQMASAFYNPSTGRWLSRDPIAERGGLNLYGFVNNNAGSWIDPYGARGISPINAHLDDGDDSLDHIPGLDTPTRNPKPPTPPTPTPTPSPNPTPTPQPPTTPTPPPTPRSDGTALRRDMIENGRECRLTCYCKNDLYHWDYTQKDYTH